MKFCFFNFFFHVRFWIEMIFLFSFLICFGMFAVTSNCTIDSRLPNGDEVASYAADADRLTIGIFRILAS